MTATQFVRQTIVVPCCLVIGTCAVLVSCERITQEMEIEETREISSYTPSATTFVSSAQRFGMTEEESNAGAVPQENIFSWSTPEGWTEASEGGGMSGMRLIDMRFGANQEGECFLSMMPGNAGGLDANLNRWRKQMGLEEYTPDELAALPKKPLFGQEATYIDFEGDFTNVGAAPLKGYRMVGLIQQTPKFTLFVKMTGPKDLVEANLPAFEEFANSIGLKR